MFFSYPFSFLIISNNILILIRYTNLFIMFTNKKDYLYKF